MEEMRVGAGPAAVAGRRRTPILGWQARGYARGKRGEHRTPGSQRPDIPKPQGARKVGHTSNSLREIPAQPPGRVRRAGGRFMGYCSPLVERRWFQRLLVWAFGLWAALQVLSVVVLVTALGFKLGGAEADFRSDALDTPRSPI
jgi:hypothetical protein